MQFIHIPVLFEESLEALQIKSDGIYVDGTMGGGGHSEAIAKRIESGRLLSLDRDPDAICAGQVRLAAYPQVSIAKGKFSEIGRLAADNDIVEADGVLLDIGVSSFQLDNPERGFSYHLDAPLDMRMSKKGPSARDLVNGLSQKELSEIIFQFGEDKSANRIASAIVRERTRGEITTTAQLADIIREAVPAAVRRNSGHPARKTFQALRIAVNHELEELEIGLIEAFKLLKKGGRLVVITFHSLEDRIVKQQMLQWATGCICPKDFPVCVCGKTPEGRLLYKKGKAPSESEVEHNSRARSARLRAIEKR